ncbi:rod shape-determining protein MreD [Cyclobacterium lianum]|uniref:Rod shape-determining protein MreD n=1 Tax=Cyclobacterium lianum TaxID=388280 RepID=A0A1M7JMG2_9BACT|nr:rod shape-determining protein MreD [Cyclobacterium lianum]SHM54250.1 rod shape-determining protein MreD [Cyclobacterium lianum]
MTTGKILKYSLGFVIYFLIQVFILKDLVLFGYAFSFLYVFFILGLPHEMPAIPIMLIGFFMGILIDLFYDSLGMHAASAVLLGFLRNPWIQVNTPTGGYDDNVPPTLLNMGMGWYLFYSIPLILIHHLLFFYIDILGTELYLPFVIRVAGSLAFTFILGIIVQAVFYKKERVI